MIDVWLLDHSRHRILHVPGGKLIVCVLVPQKLQIKVRALHDRLEERQVPRMRYCLGGVMEIFVERNRECTLLSRAVFVDLGAGSLTAFGLRCSGQMVDSRDGGLGGKL